MTTDDIMALADEYAKQYEWSRGEGLFYEETRQTLRQAIEKLAADAERYRGQRRWENTSGLR